jgi:rubrerythrin
MEKLNFDDLNEGLNFVFVGPQEQFTTTMEQCQDLSNVHFVTKLDYRNLTDKFIEEQALVIINQTNTTNILDAINFPNIELDWYKAIKTFEVNFDEREPTNKMYKWGQQVPYDTEIICNNCGYIDNAHVDSVYGICPVCQSGLPESPTEPEIEFWTNLN